MFLGLIVPIKIGEIMLTGLGSKSSMRRTRISKTVNKLLFLRSYRGKFTNDGLFSFPKILAPIFFSEENTADQKYFFRRSCSINNAIAPVHFGSHYRLLLLIIFSKVKNVNFLR